MKPARTPSGLLSLYAMIFVSVVADVAIVPLLPTLTRQHGLSPLATALLLSTTTFAMVVVTLPLGRLADRVGARPLVALAGAFVVLGSLVLALAGGCGTARRAHADRHRERHHLDGRRDDRGRPRDARPARPGARSRPAAAASWSARCSQGCSPTASEPGRRSQTGGALALPVTIFFALQRAAAGRAPRGSRSRPLSRAAAHRNRLVVYAMLATVLLGFVGGMGNLLERCD